jgi:hypothetical protein
MRANHGKVDVFQVLDRLEIHESDDTSSSGIRIIERPLVEFALQRIYTERLFVFTLGACDWQ